MTPGTLYKIDEVIERVDPRGEYDLEDESEDLTRTLLQQPGKWPALWRFINRVESMLVLGKPIFDVDNLPDEIDPKSPSSPLCDVGKPRRVMSVDLESSLDVAVYTAEPEQVVQTAHAS